MAATLKSAREEYGIDPKHHYFELEDYLDRLHGKELKNTALWKLAKKLAGKAHPSYRDRLDTRWDCFYLPMRRSGRLIAVPLSLAKYKGNYWAYLFGSGHMAVKRGRDEIEPFYMDVLGEAADFVRAIKKTGNRILDMAVPYDLRSGRVKGKHLMEKRLLSGRRRADILRSYNEHIAKQKSAGGVSLEEYLGTCVLCYRAAYGRKTEGMSPQEMYWRWADKRHGGMLDIKDKKGREEYSKWYRGGMWSGSHPFEIVFSWRSHGIHLYPPSWDKPHYALMVTNYAYAMDFVRMVEALIKHDVPFEARGLGNVLDFLTGETYFAVNEYDEHMFHYIPSEEYRKKYFRRIEWEKPKVPRWI